MYLLPGMASHPLSGDNAITNIDNSEWGWGKHFDPDQQIPSIQI